MYHIPYCIITAGHPMIQVDGLITIDTYKIFGRSELTVKFSGSYYDFLILCETFSCFLHNGESYR